MKNIMKDQATNRVKIIGKLLNVTFREGKLNDGREYESAAMTIRVTQTYGGREETSEIPISMFAAKYTAENKSNPGYEQIQAIHKLKTAQNVGIDEADTIKISSGNVRENNFVSKSGQLISGWQLNTSFAGSGTGKDVASFTIDIFIMDMKPEEDREGDATGRLIIKGAIVQYAGNLDVVEFIVEDPEAVDYIERNWNINDTVTVMGRVRMTAAEEKTAVKSSWGEEIPDTTTKITRELIITTGDDVPKEEDFAYDPVEIKKAFNVRKAKIEQLQVDAKNSSNKNTKTATATATTTAASTTSKKYDWEE